MYGRNGVAKRLALICCGVFLTVLPHNVDAQTAQQIAKKVFRSTVLLVMEDAGGQPVSLGSGFFVREGEIASNLHVVEGALRGYAKIVGEKTKYDIEGITGIDPDRDLVLLRISARGTSPLSLGNSDTVQVGEPVYAVGNPQGLEGTFSQGIVSSIREVGSDKLLQITAPISPGSSGGPVLNSKGEVMGVSVATFRGGQNLNFAIPSNYLRVLLSKAGSAKQLPREKSAGEKRSILADLGGRNTEGVVGINFIWTYPACSNCGGDYTFSLRNQLRIDVRNVYCLIVFYDSAGSPIDVDIVQYRDLIPAGLAKRLSRKVDQSVQNLNKPDRSGNPGNKVECRILDFQMVD